MTLAMEWALAVLVLCDASLVWSLVIVIGRQRSMHKMQEWFNDGQMKINNFTVAAIQEARDATDTHKTWITGRLSSETTGRIADQAWLTQKHNQMSIRINELQERYDAALFPSADDE